MTTLNAPPTSFFSDRVQLIIGLPGNCVSPTMQLELSNESALSLTAIDILLHSLRNLALLRDRNILAHLLPAGRAEAAIVIHSPLERVALPAENVYQV